MFLSALVGVCPIAESQSQSPESNPQAIRVLIDSGLYAEAELEAVAQFSATGAALGYSSSDSLQMLDLLVEALVRNGKGAEARTRKLAEQAIRVGEALFGPVHASLASSLSNLGDVLIQAGEYRDATATYERVLTLRNLTGSADSQDAVDDLDRLVRSLTLVEQYDEALRVSDEALRLRETDPRQAGVRTARTLEGRGSLLQRRGDFSSARPALEKALALRESTNWNHPEIAETLSLLGEQYRLEGDLGRAREFGEKALAVARKTLRPDHPDIASYLRGLAHAVTDLGDSAAGRALREAGLAIAETALGPDHVLVGVQLNDLAISFFIEGEYLRARSLWGRALEIFERRLGPDHSRVTTAVYNLALVSHELGDFAEARRQFTRAISTWERVVGRNHIFVARAVAALAEMVSEQRRYAEAHVLYGRALTIRERVLGANHPEVAAILSLMAANVAKLGQIQLAYELSTRALRIHEQSPAGGTQRRARALTTHGTLQANQRDYSGAQESYDRALLLLRPIVGASHPQVAEVLIPLGTTLANLGRSVDSLQVGLEAEEIGRSHLRLMLRHLPERQGLEYARKRPIGLDLALSLAAAARNPPTAPILDQLIRSRGLVLDEIAERRHLSANVVSADLAPLWRALLSARQRYANLVIRGSAGFPGDQYPALLDTARREKEEAERALAEKSALFRDGLLRAEIGLDRIRASLPASSALVAFARYSRTSFERPETATSRGSKPITPSAVSRPRPAYIAFVLLGDGTQPAAVSLGSASDIDRLVARWREEATGVLRVASPVEAEKSYRAAGAALRQRVWDPLRAHVSGVDTVFVVPDGALNLVSFATLPAGETGYLIDRGPVVHYLSAERDLVSSETPKTNNGGLLAVGAPAFDDATLFTQTQPPNRESTPSVARSTSGSLIADTRRAGCGTLQEMQFGPLAGAGREAREVAALWTDSRAEVLEGRAANEQTFKRDAPGHRVLHMATHGFFLGNDCVPVSRGTRSVGGLAVVPKNQPAQPKRPGVALSALTENPLLMSGLALAGANRRAAAATDDEDGILTAEEVSAMNLDGVEWAVLSACDTGLGEVRAGEGVFGLRRAFQIAGVRTVIMSVWSVDDEATRVWMRALYQNRLQKRLNTAEAMRAASLDVLRDRRNRGQSTHPFYWGAFVAAGDWR